MIGCFTLNQVLLPPMPSSQALGALAAFSRNSWLIDSVASNHMTGDQHQFNNFTPCQSLSPITVADGSVSNVSGFGTVHTSYFELNQVLHVPKLSFNLLSINQITKPLNCSMTFFPTHCIFQDLQLNTMIGHGSELGGVYYLTRDSLFVAAAAESVSPFYWHYQLGHPNLYWLKKVVF